YRTTLSFGRELDRLDEIGHEIDELAAAQLENIRARAVYTSVRRFASVGSTALIVGVGALLVDHGTTTVGTVSAFVLFLTNLFSSVEQLASALPLAQTARAGFRRLVDVLDFTPEVREHERARALPQSGTLELDAVSFAYAGGPVVLHDVSLRVEPG